MKVLFVSSSRKCKGISPFIYSQGESLRNLGLDIEYYLLEGSGYFNYLKSIISLRKRISKNKYDLLHAHFGYSGIVTKLAGFRYKIICSFLGDDLEGTVKPNQQYSKFSKMLVKINVLFAKYFYSFNIVKSESLKLKLTNVHNCSIIPNGVDLEMFNALDRSEACSKLNIDIRNKYILFAGNPVRLVKNVKLFKESIKYWADDWKPLFLENVKSNEVVYFYNASNVVVLTSFHEGSPNVIKEAMACNRPIVATNVGDVEWIFGDTKGCYLSSFNPNDLAEKIGNAVDYSVQFGGTNGRERIVELGLDSETIANKIIIIYQKVLND